jgi:hypothetical protein
MGRGGVPRRGVERAIGLAGSSVADALQEVVVDVVRI